jgi:hypothetical protein
MEEPQPGKGHSKNRNPPFSRRISYNNQTSLLHLRTITTPLLLKHGFFLRLKQMIFFFDGAGRQTTVTGTSNNNNSTARRASSNNNNNDFVNALLRAC